MENVTKNAASGVKDIITSGQNNLSEFIGNVIKADSVVSEQEQPFFSQWRKEFNL